MSARTAQVILFAVCVVIAVLLLTEHVSIEAGAAGFTVALVVLRLFAARLGRREGKLR
jgi:multisubunit Na+/H+ antiporter MnhE subunit